MHLRGLLPPMSDSKATKIDILLETANYMQRVTEVACRLVADNRRLSEELARARAAAPTTIATAPPLLPPPPPHPPSSTRPELMRDGSRALFVRAPLSLPDLVSCLLSGFDLPCVDRLGSVFRRHRTARVSYHWPCAQCCCSTCDVSICSLVLLRELVQRDCWCPGMSFLYSLTCDLPPVAGLFAYVHHLRRARHPLGDQQGSASQERLRVSPGTAQLCARRALSTQAVRDSTSSSRPFAW
jgi:hypothetical protein